MGGVDRARLRVIAPAEQRVMRWKNGQGSTTELWVDPPSADVDAFDVRLSIATVRASGAFSSFPGVERVILQLEGPPMTLHHEGHGETRLTLLVPHRFAGEWVTHARVPAPLRDFNLMVRRASGRGTLEVWRGPGDHSLRGEGTNALYVLAGAVSARAADLEVTVREGHLLLAGPAIVSLAAESVVIAARVVA